MSRTGLFLDETPGEVRGVVVRDGRFDRLLIQRDKDPAGHRLGAVSVGRVAAVDPGLKGAFVDLGALEPFGFLPLRKDDRLAVGAKVEVEVTAEPRERKGPTLRLTGAGEGEPRLLRPGPTVAEQLAEQLAGLAAGETVQTGAEAIRAGLGACEEALGTEAVFAEAGVRLTVERTRALVAVDIDHAAAPGRDGRRDKVRANRDGLTQAARLIRLKSWGGLVAVDLVGTGHDGATMLAAARAAFGNEPGIGYGPVNRFGVLMLSLPWRTTPLEERLNGLDGRPTAETRAIEAVRQLRLALAGDTAVPYLTLSCPPDIAGAVEALAGRLGPRARVKADPALSDGCEIKEG